MTEMAPCERTFCRSVPWRAFTRRLVVPLVVRGRRFEGCWLEVGAGAGVMAESLLERNPKMTVVATDLDPVMCSEALRTLSGLSGRAFVAAADATRLPFPDATFDGVASFLMLHHVIEWEEMFPEIARVLRPGGLLFGYDLVRSPVMRLLHRLERSPHRIASTEEIRETLARLPFEDVKVAPRSLGMFVQFRARRRSE
ncbi:MAG: methyltransferase type 11 [Acidimicrobiales bacterium]|nr:MAG: methyltransferase type 11 [Acidimicrobiales bacterium]